jgi:hypothetical protein
MKKSLKITFTVLYYAAFIGIGFLDLALILALIAFGFYVLFLIGIVCFGLFGPLGVLMWIVLILLLSGSFK